MKIETSNLVDTLTTASASIRWQTIPSRGMVRKRNQF